MAMAQETFPQRLMPAIGKPAATLFVEAGTDRHFIVEITFTAVAAYLGGKFLDGFVDGLGITDLGKSLGKEIKDALVAVGALISGETDAPDGASELDRHVASLQNVANQLSPHAANEAARLQAENVVRRVLQDTGLPQREAQRIAKAVGAEMLATGQEAAGRG
jgi:hypothetical protein